MKPDMQTLELHIQHEIMPLRTPFRISRGVRKDAHVVSVSLGRDGLFGRGEATPYSHYGESPGSVIAQIESIKTKLKPSLTNVELSRLLPAGAARNAVDCALWELRAKQEGRTVWQLLNLSEPASICTMVTVGLDSAANMAARAAQLKNCAVLKVKLDKENIVEKTTAIRDAAPAPDIIIDANESWTVDTLDSLGEFLHSKGVVLLEQPIPDSDSDKLLGLQCDIPICADEACHTSKDLDGLVGKYQFVNIKLDKTGGLTEAINLQQQAQKLGFGIMLGCMIGSSLAMAPALLLASQASFVDLDGPLWLANDRKHALSIDNGVIATPSPLLWGGTHEHRPVHLQ